MKRRDSIKAIAISALSTGVLLQQGCNENKTEQKASEFSIDRHPFEKERDLKLMSQRYFTDDEMATIKVLIDIIIPRDEVSGSATEAGVHEFIEFIVKDIPRHQLPLRGGLHWLDNQCLKRFGKIFRECTPAQQIEMVEEIAYPADAKPEMKQGVTFFNLLRDLTATGFFTSEMGLKDLGYMGNRPNQWNGVPDEVLQQYGLSYSERELNETVKFENS
ncbi:MAG: gluconate 2-dehydrogenase subunit 3 family protein [Cyclobacteriaceae bacterium]|nr:gluconate 2-dehydrogenase subunit 3 family protein [Cyclobacteriaceae bacterium]